MKYDDFIASKLREVKKSGFDCGELNQQLFPFQAWIVKRALLAGRYAVFADTGLGKTFMQLEWAYQVRKHTAGEVLMLAPLAVVGQTIDEASKWGVSLDGITITNYEQLDNLDASKYVGIVLDESSIIKDYSGATKKAVVENFKDTPYKLACTATPSPNDPIEIGSHAEFLNICSGSEMLSLFFINDGMKGEKWRLKGHGEKAFYRWIATWAVMLNNPSDVGFPMDGYDLPGLIYHEKKIETELKGIDLFNDTAVSAITFNAELRRTKETRLAIAADIANKTNDQVIVWIKQNEEGEYLRKLIPGSVEVQGSDTPEYKRDKLLGFARGEFRVLITKSKIAGMGLNYQNCHIQVFPSLDFSFESLYQSIRRSHRFGQTKQVEVYLITTDTMQNVSESINEKQGKFKTMQSQMIKAMSDVLSDTSLLALDYDKRWESNEFYDIRQGDSIELIKDIPDDHIDLTIFSPPFSSLYVYSDNARDLSNCSTNDEFFEHFSFLVSDLLRVTKPGRLCGIHLTQLTTLMGKDGFYSIVDFRGDVIRLFQKHGWRFHAEVTVWKDPQLAAVRTKAIQLLHSQTKRDSTVSRPGLADYLVFFRKPGENLEPVNYEGNGIPFELWTQYASPVWEDINPSDTLQYRSGKGEDDVKHITPTQLEVWKRAITLYSNPGDTVFTPFMGIGTEVWQAVKMNRKGVGFELKASYYDQAKQNLASVVQEKKQGELF